jgi:hypothetical protein
MMEKMMEVGTLRMNNGITKQRMIKIKNNQAIGMQQTKSTMLIAQMTRKQETDNSIYL